MLSYIVPVEEKAPPTPHMQLALASSGGGGEVVDELSNGRSLSPISKETSVSSFFSDLTTATASHGSITPSSTSEKTKPKFFINGGKHPTLKRVSFGSSKGSMVETLIFETPVQEEPVPSPILEDSINDEQSETEREKVRVTFFQQSKPQEVDLPDEPVNFTDTNFIMATPVVLNDSSYVVYNRTESNESGWDNPFRPGGDLSREADEIVELIKGGKPITPTPGSQPSNLHPSSYQNGDKLEPLVESAKNKNELEKSPAKNGNVKDQQKSPTGAIDVKRGTIKPEGDSAQVERVTIKKKPKCKCCVIQ